MDKCKNCGHRIIKCECKGKYFYQHINKDESVVGNTCIEMDMKTVCLCVKPELNTKKMCEKYDAYYDCITNKWLESKCKDKKCVYCSKRPLKHHPHKWSYNELVKSKDDKFTIILKKEVCK